MSKCDVRPLSEATAGEIYEDDKPNYCYEHNYATNNAVGSDDCRDSVWVFKPIELVKDVHEAQEIARHYQVWEGEGPYLYWSEVAEAQTYFLELATKFNLVDEFTENGII